MYDIFTPLQLPSTSLVAVLLTGNRAVSRDYSRLGRVHNAQVLGLIKLHCLQADVRPVTRQQCQSTEGQCHVVIFTGSNLLSRQ